MKWIVIPCLVVMLSGCSRPKSTDEWIEQLQAKNASDRLRAVNALSASTRDDPIIVPALAAVLSDADPFVRRDAARALGRLGNRARPVLPSLCDLATDRNAGVRKAALAAVRQIEPEHRQ
jgi:HEAT repeat protein